MHDSKGFPTSLSEHSSYPQPSAGHWHDNSTPTTNLRPLPPLPAHLHQAYNQPHRPHSEPSVPSGAHTILNPAPGSIQHHNSAGPLTPAHAGPSSLPNSRPSTPYTESKPATPQHDDSKGPVKRGRTTEREEGGSRIGTPLGSQNGGHQETQGEGEGGHKGTKNSKKVKVGARASIACIACR